VATLLFYGMIDGHQGENNDRPNGQRIVETICG
jgi:hypothetical protein